MRLFIQEYSHSEYVSREKYLSAIEQLLSLINEIDPELITREYLYHGEAYIEEARATNFKNKANLYLNIRSTSPESQKVLEILELTGCLASDLVPLGGIFINI